MPRPPRKVRHGWGRGLETLSFLWLSSKLPLVQKTGFLPTLSAAHREQLSVSLEPAKRRKPFCREGTELGGSHPNLAGLGNLSFLSLVSLPLGLPGVDTPREQCVLHGNPFYPKS